jgi:hypothetical protein
VHAEAHVRVLEAAELHALARVGAGLLRRDVERARVPGHHVDLALQAGHPEGVLDVAGDELEV